MELTQQTKTLFIRRDESHHRWTMQTSAGWLDTPWSDDADAVSVVMWLKGRANECIEVRPIYK